MLQLPLHQIHRSTRSVYTLDVLIGVKISSATNHNVTIVLMENITMWCIASTVKAHFVLVADTLHAATVKELLFVLLDSEASRELYMPQ